MDKATKKLSEHDAVREGIQRLYEASTQDLKAIGQIPEAVRPFLPESSPPLRDGDIMREVHQLMIDKPPMLVRVDGFWARLAKAELT